LLQGVCAPLLLVALAWLGRPRANPLRALGALLRAAVHRRGGRRLAALVLAVIGVNYVQSSCDPALTRWLGYDLTPIVASLEGDLVARLQRLVHPATVPVLAVSYVCGYLALVMAPLAVWGPDHPRAITTYVLAFAVNYLITLPFMLFFPVNEVGWSGLSRARPLLETIWPGIGGELRAGSALDNCFPSQHVSYCVPVVWFAHRHGPRGLLIVAWVGTLVIVWSVVALGIHWVLDVLSGVLSGLACCWLVERAIAPRFLVGVSEVTR
jgi:membrane-associated phospholipid phosphatase